MLLNVLLFILIAELILSLSIFKGDILAPAVGFCAVFVVAVLDLMLMVEYWGIDLSITTVSVIVTGIASFIITATIVHMMAHRKKNAESTYQGKTEIKVSNGLINFALIVSPCILLLVIYYVRKIGMTIGGTGTFGQLLGYYSSAAKRGTADVDLPFYVLILYDICVCSSYIWGYILTHNYVVNKKINKKLLIIYIISILFSLVYGSRGDFVAILFATIIMYILAFRKQMNRKLPKKLYVVMAIMIIVIGVTFQGLGTSMGRDSNKFESIEYLSIYLGGPILNLDTAIDRGGFTHPTFLSETFRNVINTLGSRLGNSDWVYSSNRIFWSSPSGKATGNVATTFYDFYHDGGMLAVILLSALMAFIVQLLYEKIRNEQGREKSEINILTVLYAYSYWLVLRSFFANSLLDSLTLSTVKLIIIWVIMAKVLPRVKIKIHR